MRRQGLQHDGKVDIFYNNLMGQIWALLRNRGDLFEYYSYESKIKRLSAPFSGWSNGFIDYNNDGWKIFTRQRGRRRR